MLAAGDFAREAPSTITLKKITRTPILLGFTLWHQFSMLGSRFREEARDSLLFNVLHDTILPARLSFYRPAQEISIFETEIVSDCMVGHTVKRKLIPPFLKKSIHNAQIHYVRKHHSLYETGICV